eukprot:357270-Chlamydomonas_euryale.AAC.1
MFACICACFCLQAPRAEALLVDEEHGAVLGVGSASELAAMAKRLQRDTLRRAVQLASRDLHGCFLMPVRAQAAIYRRRKSVGEQGRKGKQGRKGEQGRKERLRGGLL